ncbi:bacteriophage Gp15 family protein, partial [Herbiconiux daphne]
MFEGTLFHVDMSFDNILDVFDILEDPAITDSVGAEMMLALLVETQHHILPPIKRFELLGAIFHELIQETMPEVVAYDVQGNPIIPKKVEGEEDETLQQNYSLSHDAGFIYTSFMQAYHIDLHDQFGELHWNKFKMLLRDLPDDTMFARVVEIRQRKLSDIKDAKERSHVKKLK